MIDHESDVAFVREAQALITAAGVDLETRLKITTALEFLQDVLDGRGADPPTPIAHGLLTRWRERRARVASKIRLRRLCGQA